MSEGLVSVRPDINNMMRLRVRIAESPSSTELERVREQIYSRLADTAKGVVLDFQEVGRTSVDALSVLNTARNFAASEGKRLILYKITPEFAELLQEHESVFHFDVHGFTRPVAKPAAPAKPASRFSPEAKRRFRNIALAVGILFPAVLAVEYYLIYQTGGEEPALVTKSFEAGTEPFVLSGNVDLVVEGLKKPAANATIVAVPVRADGTAIPGHAWSAVTNNLGDYRLPLPLDSYETHLDVEVLITSPALTRPGGVEDEGFFPTYRNQLAIRSGQPLDVDATFVVENGSSRDELR